MKRFLLACLLSCVTVFNGAAPAEAAELRVVGVLGNTAGLGQPPVPYAFYTGIALDLRERLWLAGATSGLVCCDQDGKCRAVVPLPGTERRQMRSVLVSAEDAIFAVATTPHGESSALYRLDVSEADAAQCRLERVAEGPGHWAVPPIRDAAGRVLVGQADLLAKRYRVLTLDPRSRRLEPLFELTLPAGAQPPWRHLVQAEQDGSVSIEHHGGQNFSGRFNRAGQRVGEAEGGQVLDGLRYSFGYGGQLVRTGLDGRPAPGECGAMLQELRMAAQVVATKGRYFFVGRGGAVEAQWNGQNFEYRRRIGAIFLEDMYVASGVVYGIAHTAAGNNDVQHPVMLPREQRIGELLHEEGPLHSRQVVSLVPGPHGQVYISQVGPKVTVFRQSRGYGDQEVVDVELPKVKRAGQACVLGDKTLLLADPESGTVWQREVTDRTDTVTPWQTGLPGVTAIAANEDAVYVATASEVRALAMSRGARVDPQDAGRVLRSGYQGVRRIAATRDHLYVLDAAAGVVEQLSTADGRVTGRLDGLRGAHALAADQDACYIAENGTGRVLVATTTLWKPDLRPLPRDQIAPVVAVPIPLELPQPLAAGARMSVNVFDADDLTVRQLVAAEPVANQITWDGRDYLERWAKPGRYRYHGLIQPQLGLKYVGSVGNAGTPPYRTADGKGSWGGVWGNVFDVVAVGPEPDSDIVVLWGFEEGEGGLIRMSQDGQVRWKQHIEWWLEGTQVAAACDGQSVYVIGASAHGVPAAKDGQPFWERAQRPLLWRVDVATGARQPYVPGHLAEQQSPKTFGQPAPATQDYIGFSLAVHGGRLFIASPRQGKVFVADSRTGQELAAWDIPGASGVAVVEQGVLVGRGRSIELRDLSTGALKQRLVADAGGPVWDLERVGASAFAATIGQPRQQVVFFSGAGAELRAIGEKGGRPASCRMRPAALRRPAGFCVHGNGRVFVAEDAPPRRFARFDAQGRFERHFVGPYYMSGMWGVDDEQPEYFYADSHRDLVRYRFDYQTGQWDVDAHWEDFYAQSGVPAKWMPQIRHRDGRTFWCSGSGAIIELLEDRARGVAAVYGGWVKPVDGPSAFEPTRDRPPAKLKGTWSDLNGDGQKQASEWQVTDRSAYPLDADGPQQGWNAYFDRNFNLYMHDWSDGSAAGIWKIPVAEWKHGVPVYRWEQAHHAGLNRVTGIGRGSHGCRTAFAHDGAVFGFNGAYNDVKLPGVGHGADWRFSQITKYDEASGRMLWHAGQRASGFQAPGQLACPVGAAGAIGSYLLWTEENSRILVWDLQHGLYCDMLLEDLMRNPVPSPYTVWVELFNSRVWRHPKTGRVYLGAGSDAIHIYEITGLDTPPVRFSGQFELTPAQLAAARREVERLEQARKPGRRLSIPRVNTAVTIDGDLREFGSAPPISLALREGARGAVRLMHDDTHLYAAWDVEDDSPWKNQGDELTTLFKTGDCVDLWIGKDNCRRIAEPGDVRIMVAPPREGSVSRVVAFRAKVTSGAKPVPFRSPSGEVILDLVEPLASARAIARISEHGYRVELAIPRSAIGLTEPTREFGLDVDINFSDPAGQRNTCRLHWARNGAAITYDLPTEARLEPELWGLGILD